MMASTARMPASFRDVGRKAAPGGRQSRDSGGITLVGVLELGAAAGAQRVVELDDLPAARAGAPRLVALDAVEDRRDQPEERARTR